MPFTSWQLDAIRWLQTDWSVELMARVTDAGRSTFYLLVIGVVFWAVDTRLGARLAVLAVAGGLTNRVIKYAVAAPRPFWLDPAVRLGGPVPGSFGFPSGHAQSAATVYGGLARWAGGGAVWRVVRVLAVVVIVVVGLSRPVLGVHSFDQVLVGWSIGGALVLAAVRWETAVVAWFRARSWPVAIVVVGGLAVAILAVGLALTEWRQGWEPEPAVMASIEARVAASGGSPSAAEILDVTDRVEWPAGAGFLGGIGAGLILADRRGLLGPLRGLGWPARAGRLTVGLITTGLVALAVSLVPDGPWGVIGPFLAQAILGFAVVFVSPWLSARLRLHPGEPARPRSP